MNTLVAPKLDVALYEGSGSRPLTDAERFQVIRSLLDKGYRVSSIRAPGSAGILPASDRSKHLEGFAGGTPALPGNTLLVLGHFVEQQPVQALAAGQSVQVVIRDLGEMDAAAVADLVDQFRAGSQLAAPGAWKPWFPVIDYSRCTNCMQCLSFCLFDVYGTSAEGKIQVQNQNNCKTDCPACSRVCPEVAILFPKYRHGPIHGGEVNADDVRREAMKVDISALLGGDIYQALRDRSAKAKSRFSKERDDERALKERQKCLLQLQKDLDIPAEVLAALPTPEEIQAKAEAAMARARAARDMA